MIDISKGRYWDKPWSLVDGCTPCSPGCDHCWSAAMAHRFVREGEPGHTSGVITDEKGRFNGAVVCRPERRSIPLKRRKPTVYAVWNDLFHEAVPGKFINEAWLTMINAKQHTFLILSKRPQVMLRWTQVSASAKAWPVEDIWSDHIYLGLTVCNQQEADEKIPVFLRVSGKKFLSLEPLLGPIDFRKVPGFNRVGMDLSDWNVLVGGETGLGARPMHPDWVRSVRDQCAAAGVPFFFKQWGSHPWDSNQSLADRSAAGYDITKHSGGGFLDGRTHDDLPWRNGCVEGRG